MRRESWIACSCCHQALSQVPGETPALIPKEWAPRRASHLCHTYMYISSYTAAPGNTGILPCANPQQQNICSGSTIKVPTLQECRKGRPFPLMVVGNQLALNICREIPDSIPYSTPTAHSFHLRVPVSYLMLPENVKSQQEFSTPGTI